jgi:hypothetical protein
VDGTTRTAGRKTLLVEPLSLGGETHFTPFVALVNNVQFDTLSDPLWAFFASLDRRAASKVLYTHRF